MKYVRETSYRAILNSIPNISCCLHATSPTTKISLLEQSVIYLINQQIDLAKLNATLDFIEETLKTKFGALKYDIVVSVC